MCISFGIASFQRLVFQKQRKLLEFDYYKHIHIGVKLNVSIYKFEHLRKHSPEVFFKHLRTRKQKNTSTDLKLFQRHFSGFGYTVFATNIDVPFWGTRYQNHRKKKYRMSLIILCEVNLTAWVIFWMNILSFNLFSYHIIHNHILVFTNTMV